MEEIRRKIKLFYAIYGNFLFMIIGIIAVILFTLHIINNIYEESLSEVNDTQKNQVSEQKNNVNEEDLKNMQENKELISEFFDYCKNKEINNAYEMLSKNCIEEKYLNQSVFINEFINKLFMYEKDYKIEEINDSSFKITIIDGILETGKIENRDKKEVYCKVINEEKDRKIFVER